VLPSLRHLRVCKSRPGRLEVSIEQPNFSINFLIHLVTINFIPAASIRCGFSVWQWRMKEMESPSRTREIGDGSTIVCILC